MSDLISIANNIIVRLRTDNKATLKAAIAEWNEFNLSGTPDDAAKTKVLFLDYLTETVEELSQSTLVTEVDMLRGEILKVMEDSGKASFKLGSLLVQSRACFDDQQSFLVWLYENFGIKKAWAFKMMKVSQVFSGEPWSSVPSAVLYTLQSQADDEQMAEAKKFAELGKLNTQTLKALLQPPVPATPAPAVKSTQAETKAAERVQAALMDVSPSDVSASLPTVVQPTESATVKPVVQIDNSKLEEQIAELLKVNLELTNQLAELKKPRITSGNLLPMLPQFSSECLYARLGLAKEDSTDKDKILEAFKALCKAGYGRSHKEAFALLDEARHNLIHANDEV